MRTDSVLPVYIRIWSSCSRRVSISLSTEFASIIDVNSGFFRDVVDGCLIQGCYN